MTIQNIKKKKRLKKWFIGFLIALFFIEIYLRAYWGFCNSVLMMESKNYEYIAQPNQSRFRFRNHILYNSFSMRSPEPDTSAFTILGLGDSVINGGVMVDQDSLATTILSKELTEISKKKVQVLNISAGSWGPDNTYAYLKEKGDFKAKVVLLVVSSHDAYDNMDFLPVIDKVPRFESHQYLSAIWELTDRYAIPYLKGAGNFDKDIPVKKNGIEFNTGFMNLYQYCQNKKIPFIVYLNPDIYELKGKKYYIEGQRIIKFCTEYKIPIIEGISNTEINDYRGPIHMNSRGQRHMANAILPAVLKYVQ